MLDAFIIERIRQQKRDSARSYERVPLRIEIPRPEPDRGPAVQIEKSKEEREERGVAIIDFSI